MKKIGAITRIIRGIKDTIPFIATFKQNIQEPHSIDKNGNPIGTGKVDWIRLSTNLILLTLIGLVATGKLTVQDLGLILQYIKEYFSK